MKKIRANIEIINAVDWTLYQDGYIQENEIHRSEVNAIIDSHWQTMIINEKLAYQLKLVKIDKKVVILPNGTKANYAVVGPLLIKFENRTAICSALVLPNSKEVVLGSIPMLEMDVLVDSINQKLIVNPERPYIAGGLMISIF